MKHRRIFCWLLLCGTQSLRAGQLELQEELPDIRKDPVIFPAGLFEFAPIFEASESYNDNIFSRDTLRRDSFLTQFHAGGQLALQRQLNEYKLIYTLQSSQYHNSPQDDYVDHFVGGTSHLEFTSRNRLDVNLGYLDSHYQRGRFLERGLISPGGEVPGSELPLPIQHKQFIQPEQPDQYQLHSANINYRYGRVEAKGNLELNFGIEDYSFQNNREYTANQDRTEITVMPGFFFRVAPKTVVQANVENVFLSHRQNAVSQYDYLKQRFLVGGSWTYSEKIKLEAHAGYLRQSFNDEKYKGYEDATWNLSAHWSPFSYSSLNLTIDRDATPTIASNNLRTSDRFRLDWTHDWTSRVTSQLFGSRENAENLGADRNDEYTSVGIDLRYGVRRWLGVGINYSYRMLKADYQILSPDNQPVDYTQNVIMFYITGNPRISDEARTPWSTWY